MTNKIVKRMISLPMILCLTVLCLVTGLTSQKAFAGTKEVSLLSTDITCTDSAGGYTMYYASLSILVKNIAYEKKVSVHYKDEPSNTWRDADAHYAYSLDNGYEVWTVKCPQTSTFYGKFEYCLKYQVNGETYWDNNYGRNYITNCGNETNW